MVNIVPCVRIERFVYSDVKLWYVMLCYVMLWCYVMLCYVMLCYVMLCDSSNNCRCNSILIFQLDIAMIFLEIFPCFYGTQTPKTPITGTILNSLNPPYALPPYFPRISIILPSIIWSGKLYDPLWISAQISSSISHVQLQRKPNTPTRSQSCQSVGEETK